MKILFLCLLFLTSCSKNTEIISTRTTASLTHAEAAIISSFALNDIAIDLTKYPGRKFTVKEVISNPYEANYSFFYDQWGKEILCMYKDGHIYIWSCGPNKINDYASKDDIIRVINLDEISSE